MSFLKKRKNKILLGVITGVTSASIIVGASLYFLNSDSRNKLRSIGLSKLDVNLINKNNLDIQNANPSINDQNLKEIQQEQKLPDKQPPKPIIEIPKKPEPEPEKQPEKPKEEIIEKPKPKPKPKEEKVEPAPTPKPFQPAPSPRPEKRLEKRKITVNGVEVEAIVEVFPDRIISDYDKQNKLANPDPYLNHRVGDVISIEVTQNLIDKTARDLVKEGIKESWLRKGLIDQYEGVSEDKVAELLSKSQNIGPWEKLIYRFSRLIDSGNFIKFLKEDKKPEYEKKTREKEWKSEEHRKYWIIKNLDHSKFSKLAKNASDQLAKGFTPSSDNLYVDENGNLDSHSYSPPDGFNHVTSRIQNDNQNRRAFSFDSIYPRTSNDIEKGDYPGWKKTDVTSQYEKYGIKSEYGIKVTELTNENGVKRKKGIVIDIDASNSKGYENTQKIIEKLKSENVEITGYRIHNMGKGNAAQSFKNILKALPDKLPLLELFFDANSTNTSSLIALEGKEIEELSLYTLGNSLLDTWNINPNALRNVKWINTNDYNVGFDYRPGSKIATRIVFNSLSFDPIDFNNSGATLEEKLKKINDGLRLAYWVRNNEPFFQGSHGPGLKPDHNEQNNSYHQGLDLSRIPEIRSLKGFIFYDKEKPANSIQRKIRRLKLFSKESIFEISGEELSEAGFDKHIVRGEPGSKSKILFSSPNADKVKITGKGTLSHSAISNLSVLYSLAENLYLKKIVVEPGADQLKSQLEGLGYQVETSNDSGIIFT
ncbi:putative immunoglobulin-blocking virulence protein [Mycoplasma phocoeninasale]|uniref:putative immunoglobulin-blocking virulence protein n=1 Tax=Mycoplasma phocoeninasale TaxID=2726117 RepID=UPI001966D2CA|nr:putative immunoglobulin-blocking virulence protein [Mycoplasma phocoeninasale]MBN0970624.1 putative immunoglobulin-blocking virulence protein [Mycoplasma phocoeninasale]